MKWVRKARIKIKRSLKRKPRKVHGSWELMKISRQNILKINEGKSPLGIHRGRRQIQQYDQDNRRKPGLVGYAMWKSDTKSAAWVSLDIRIHLNLSPVSSYSSQITLYRSLHAHWQSILEFTIWEISYLGSPSIITGVKTSYIFSEKVLEVAGSNIDTWKTR